MRDLGIDFNLTREIASEYRNTSDEEISSDEGSQEDKDAFVILVGQVSEDDSSNKSGDTHKSPVRVDIYENECVKREAKSGACKDSSKHDSGSGYLPENISHEDGSSNSDNEEHNRNGDLNLSGSLSSSEGNEASSQREQNKESKEDNSTAKSAQNQFEVLSSEKSDDCSEKDEYDSQNDWIVGEVSDDRGCLEGWASKLVSETEFRIANISNIELDIGGLGGC